MNLRRLMLCSVVGLSALSVAASAAGPHKSSLKSPLASTHHASYKPGSKPPGPESRRRQEEAFLG